MSEALAREPEQAPELTIERDFAHPPEAVFAAWTDQAALRQWIGPGEVRAPDAEMDARVGGSYAFPMLMPDGTSHTVRGTISELVPNERLRFSWIWDQDDGSQGQPMDVAIEFRRTDTGTRLVLHHTNFIDIEARDKHAFGWNGCCDSLAAFLAG